MSEFWLISAPGDKENLQALERMNMVTSKSNLSYNTKFAIPDFKVKVLGRRKEVMVWVEAVSSGSQGENKCSKGSKTENQPGGEDGQGGVNGPDGTSCHSPNLVMETMDLEPWDRVNQKRSSGSSVSKEWEEHRNTWLLVSYS